MTGIELTRLAIAAFMTFMILCSAYDIADSIGPHHFAVIIKQKITPAQSIDTAEAEFHALSPDKIPHFSAMFFERLISFSNFALISHLVYCTSIIVHLITAVIRKQPKALLLCISPAFYPC
jgi:hypothetical protein